MSEETLDILGEILWVGMFITPLITIPLMWLNKMMPKKIRIVIGLILAFILSIALYFTSISIAFRHGMGPG